MERYALQEGEKTKNKGYEVIIAVVKKAKFGNSIPKFDITYNELR